MLHELGWDFTNLADYQYYQGKLKDALAEWSRVRGGTQNFCLFFMSASDAKNLPDLGTTDQAKYFIVHFLEGYDLHCTYHLAWNSDFPIFFISFLPTPSFPPHPATRVMRQDFVHRGMPNCRYLTDLIAWFLITRTDFLPLLGKNLPMKIKWHPQRFGFSHENI